MSPARDEQSTQATFGELGLSINGVGATYPPFSLVPQDLDRMTARWYPDTPAMKKIKTINYYTGIEQRSSVGPCDHPLVNQEKAPSMGEICKVFHDDGIPLAVSAAKKAIADAGIDLTDITHIVSTTCTNSANPGFDHFVARDLGIKHPVQKVLLHGVGCSGGLAAIRTASNLALGASFQGRPARVLVVALEVSSILTRSELDSINELQETRIGIILFSDCASSCIVSNNIGNKITEEPVYSLLGWDYRTVPDTEHDLGFDADALGWKVILTPKVPKVASAAVAPAFNDLIATLPNLPEEFKDPKNLDWALHPGGSTILAGVEKAMSVTSEQLRASYDVYMNHGNSSSATIISVLDRLRCKDMDAVAPGGKPKEYIAGCAFGPGINVEMMMLKRNMNRRAGEMTPSDSGSDAGAPEEKPEEIEAGIENVKEKLETAIDNTVIPEIPDLVATNAEGNVAVEGIDLD